MMVEKTESSHLIGVSEKLRAYAAFGKIRLTTSVVFSSVVGYAIGATTFSWGLAVLLALGGLLITMASNGFNQLIEREQDAVMSRTMSRPIPTGKISFTEGVLLATLMSLCGLAILYFAFNTLAAVLGLLALFSYVALYTPMKKYSPWAVFVGAFPGAIPPMLGYVASTGVFDLYAGLLFAVQFMWQFPHFWAIAWVLHDDYMKVGYLLLPSKHGRDNTSAFITMMYTLLMIPVALLPWVFDLTGNISAITVIVLGIAFSFPALKLFFTGEMKWAKQLMFASFLYLPLVQLLYLFDTF